MKRTTRAWAYILLVIALNIHAIQGVVFAQDQLDESTTYTIVLASDGMATWTIERRFLLHTEDDVTSFEQYRVEFEAQKTNLTATFTSETQDLVAQASLITGRTMRTENFVIVIGTVDAATGTYGVITYQYDWIGFGKVEEGRIIVGDVFEGGFYLYRDDTLAIQYPASLGVHEASPSPDDTHPADTTVLYYGQRNFGAGEPRIIVGASVPYIPLLVGASLLGVGALAAYLTFKKKGEKTPPPFPPQKPFVVTTDTDRVIDLLHSLGGQAYQSMITKRLGFSKAKTSQLMKTMEKQRLVTRERMGREVVVTLSNRNTTYA